MSVQIFMVRPIWAKRVCVGSGDPSAEGDVVLRERVAPFVRPNVACRWSSGRSGNFADSSRTSKYQQTEVIPVIGSDVADPVRVNDINSTVQFVNSS